MKRDARIGLAVVLVLGLGVTLLVGRALYKRGGTIDDGDQFAGETGESSKSDPARASSQDNVPGLPTPANASQTGLSILSPDAQKLIDDQSKQIAGTNTPPAAPPKPNNFTDDLDHENPPLTGGGRKTETPRVEYYSYTVANGDSPWTISNKIFGDGKYGQKIFDANDLGSKKLKAGMLLKIPSIPNKQMQCKLQPFTDPRGTQHDVTGGKPVAADKHVPAPTAAKGSYKVETGDTLSTIAKKHYGSNGPKTIQTIIAANHGLDPAKLKVGQEISLPVIK